MLASESTFWVCLGKCAQWLLEIQDSRNRLSEWGVFLLYILYSISYSLEPKGNFFKRYYASLLKVKQALLLSLLIMYFFLLFHQQQCQIKLSLLFRMHPSAVLLQDHFT